MTGTLVRAGRLVLVKGMLNLLISVEVCPLLLTNSQEHGANAVSSRKLYVETAAWWAYKRVPAAHQVVMRVHMQAQTLPPAEAEARLTAVGHHARSAHVTPCMFFGTNEV